MEPLGEPQAGGAEKFLIAFAHHFTVLMNTIEFGAAAECFDEDFWRVSKVDTDTLVLCVGKTPSDAIDRLLTYSEARIGYEGLETSKLDCVEVIEVCRWLAERDVIGVPAFNLKYGVKPLRLSAPGSTGVISMALGCRAAIDGDGGGDSSYCAAGAPLAGIMDVTVAGSKHSQQVDLAMCLGGLPIGSGVMWRTFDAKVHPDDDFKNENTVKIGDNLYAAHPLGIFSLQEMGLRFATPHYDDMVERIPQLIDELAEVQSELLALQTPPDAQAAGGDQTDGTQTVAVVAPPAKDVRRKINMCAKQIRNIQRILASYHGINSAADYMARFVRVVEAETFVNPCGDL